jgi:endonuclease YncB( thermonuclease family)
VRPRARRKTTAALLGSALGCAALLAIAGLRPSIQHSQNTAAPARSVPEPQETTKKVAEQLGALPPAPLTLFKMVPPHQVLDGLTFIREGVEVRLARLEGPSRDEVCFDGDGLMWACGLRARVALHNLVARREFRCQPIARSAPGKELADCDDGSDLGRRLVELGWARPIPGEEQAYGAELDVCAAGDAGALERWLAPAPALGRASGRALPSMCSLARIPARNRFGSLSSRIVTLRNTPNTCRLARAWLYEA